MLAYIVHNFPEQWIEYCVIWLDPIVKIGATFGADARDWAAGLPHLVDFRGYMIASPSGMNGPT
jgi:hypothetical protein